MNQSCVYSLQTSNFIWMGRVLRTISGAMLRYFRSKAGLCSEKLSSDWGRPASTMATLRPASERRLAAQPPEAPEPTTSTSKVEFFSDGIVVLEFATVRRETDAIKWRERGQRRK